MKTPTVGLLPLYVGLYDESVPELREEVAPLVGRVVDMLKGLGCGVLTADISCFENEVQEAVDWFEENSADALVTLHLAYSPSLESIDPLSHTDLPIVVLDTTPAQQFGPQTDPAQMMLNHGIHGVQDLCNLLVRNQVPFEICAGHLDDPQVPEKLRIAIRGAQAASALRGSKVGLIGSPFAGMGDFRVDKDQLESTLGVRTIEFENSSAVPVSAIEEDAVKAEVRSDLNRFGLADGFATGALEISERTGLAVRQWAADQRLDGLSINFMATKKDDPYLPVMPFLECSKLMERGLGYAGEGDVLTAAWVGALLQVFDDVTFTEMFCPDWKTGSVFLSHMGEFNYSVSAEPPVVHNLPFPYTSAGDPVVAYGTLRPGRAAIANLSPIGEGRFGMILAKGEVLRVEQPNRMNQLVSGWFKPDIPLSEFLEEFSEAGGIHHSALVYGGDEILDVMEAAGRFLGTEIVLL